MARAHAAAVRHAGRPGRGPRGERDEHPRQDLRGLGGGAGPPAGPAAPPPPRAQISPGLWVALAHSAQVRPGLRQQLRAGHGRGRRRQPGRLPAGPLCARLGPGAGRAQARVCGTHSAPRRPRGLPRAPPQPGDRVHAREHQGPGRAGEPRGLRVLERHLRDPRGQAVPPGLPPAPRPGAPRRHGLHGAGPRAPGGGGRRGRERGGSA
mmetsp:Transcript_19169/g.64218  ORF Transcript_19169/g.64218 Transcript_19169/m.64218 type:complete len:208 (+) Transcript_19169:416-1039(+)